MRRRPAVLLFVLLAAWEVLDAYGRLDLLGTKLRAAGPGGQMIAAFLLSRTLRLALIVAGLFLAARRGSDAAASPEPPKTPEDDPASPQAICRPEATPSEYPKLAARSNVLPIDLHALSRFYDEHTDHQADRLMEPYLGKRVQVTGTVSDVSRRGSNGGFNVLLARDGRSGVSFMVEIAPDLAATVEHLRKGDHVTFVAAISGASSTWVMLRDGELVG